VGSGSEWVERWLESQWVQREKGDCIEAAGLCG
jgi:hypothetical protein